MGTVNYFTSDYITLGIRPYDVNDFLKDKEFIKTVKEEVDEYGGTVEDAVYDYITDCYEYDLSNVKCELEKHSFYYFYVAVRPGYYEGFTIEIEPNFPLAYDWYEDKCAAQKEVTEIKEFLMTCAGLGLVSCYPGWCPGYANYEQTLKDIKEAVKEMRMQIKATPTFNQFERSYS